MRIDQDLKDMTPAQLRREAMRLRRAFKKELDHTGNHRCWITLLQAVFGRIIQPLSWPKPWFMANCSRYYDRNNPDGGWTSEMHADLAKMFAAVTRYERLLKRSKTKPVNFPHNELSVTTADRLGHCLGMLPQMREFLVCGKFGKFFRWLGFVQGVLWAEGIYTLNDLKDHNRS